MLTSDSQPNNMVQRSARTLTVSLRRPHILFESRVCSPGGLKVKQLSAQQCELVSSLAKRLGAITGIKAVVLGGSHARGRAHPGSDIDLYILYSEAAPFSTLSIRELAEAVNDTHGPVVTDFYGWGPWVNGGAWLTIGGQRVDFLYRSLEHMERVIAEAEAGRYEQHYAQQPPFGFFSGAYLGEIAVCIPLFDPEARLEALKRRVANYPEALRQAVVQDYLCRRNWGSQHSPPSLRAVQVPTGPPPAWLAP